MERQYLIQTRRIRPLPVILVGADYWNGLVEWIRTRLLDEGMISPEDIEILQVIDDPEAVLPLQDGKESLTLFGWIVISAGYAFKPAFMTTADRSTDAASYTRARAGFDGAPSTGASWERWAPTGPV